MPRFAGPFQVVASSKEKGATVVWKGGNSDTIVYFRDIDFEDRQTRVFTTFSMFDQLTAVVSHLYNRLSVSFMVNITRFVI
jgi:hypothetical protein